jgi:hypothetical protein
MTTESATACARLGAGLVAAAAGVIVLTRPRAPDASGRIVVAPAVSAVVRASL